MNKMMEEKCDKYSENTDRTPEIFSCKNNEYRKDTEYRLSIKRKSIDVGTRKKK